MHRVFRPADSLTSIVGTGRKSVGPAERRQGSHHSVLPREAETDESGGGCGREESGAAPVLSVRFRRCRLADAGETAGVVIHGANLAADQSSRRVEIAFKAISPKGGVPIRISSKVGIAGYPAEVVDAVSAADRSAVGGEKRDVVLNVLRLELASIDDSG